MNSKKRLSLLIIGATVTSLMGGTVSTYAADNTETTEPLTRAFFQREELPLLQMVPLIRKISGKRPVPVRHLM